ncbi:hypothetical protein BKA62DRAFT_42920 [Auriculariales sp. MPI-PUGE-AT-0066]|nr:hypothetical protein BKA62DRAFT_42920 [Auriculariales sp. MPI-PUGE-AT-0066]
MTIETFVTAAVSSGLSETSAEYLRIASISVAAYEFLLTLPAEYRFYTTQSRWTRPSLACLLFVLIRYSSVLVITISNIGQFATFSPSACNHYFLIAPVFKVVQMIICQVILAVRTFAISKRSRIAAIVLGVAFVASTVGEAVSSIYARVPNNGTGHCTSGNLPGQKVAWLHYIFAMAFDLLTLTMSAWYLLGRQPCAYLSFSGVARVMLVDGLGYFTMLTAINIVNVVFYKSAPTQLQSAGASLGYCITMIGCQRILIHLRDLADHSTNRTPKRPTTNGVSGPDASAAHELAIRVTIQRDVEAYTDASDPPKTTTNSMISAHKDPRSFDDDVV